MERLPRPLLWEIANYDCSLPCVLECCSGTLRNKMVGDLSFFQYFLESSFILNSTNVRLYDLQELKSALRFEISKSIYLLDLAFCQ
jgi:hypothetical protein